MTVTNNDVTLSINGELDRIFTAQGAAQNAVRRTTVAERLTKLRRLRDAIQSQSEAIFAALFADLGKPQSEAMTDLGAPLWEIGIAEQNLEEWVKPQPVAVAGQSTGSSAYVMYEPKGRVLVFGAWNVPFGLTMQPLVAAIAAGNTVVVKPSELAPATSVVIAQIISATFTEDEVAVVEGGPEVAQALLDLPFDHIFFTGSSATGRRVMTAAAQHLSSVTLELGGKSPVIVGKDSDVAQAARCVVIGKFGNAGQICVAPDHVWIPKHLRDDFVEVAIQQIANSYYDGDELREDALACIVNERHQQRLLALIEDAVARGARVAHGGKRSGRRIVPTILVDVPIDAQIMQEEIFGPILPILTYDDARVPIDHIVRAGKPLALYIFSEDEAFVENVLSSTSSGGVTINGIMLHPAEAGLPFGGVGSSGMGAYHGIYSFHELSHRRAVYVQSIDAPVPTDARVSFGG